MLSAMSCSPAEMKILVPVPRSMPRSVPQCGSVRHMVPVHSPETSLVRVPAGDQLGQVGRLLLGGAVGMQGVHGAVGQARVHAPGPVGLADHLADGQPEGFRQTLAAVLDVMGQARPAAFDELLVGLLEAGRGLHAVGAPGAAFQVANAVQRSDHLFAELRTFLEDGVDHVGSRVFGARQALVVRFVAQQLVANETDITQGAL